MQQVGRLMTALVVVALLAVTASWQTPTAAAQAEGADFILNGSWWRSPAVDFRVNLDGAPPGALDAILSAAETWNAVPGSQAQLRYVGPTSAASRLGDDVNVVYWAPLYGADGTDEMPLGRTEFLVYRDCIPYCGILETDVRIASNRPITNGALNSSNFDLESLVLHEFGHALGLAHPSSSNEVMFMTLMAGTEARALGPGDTRALQIRYPASNGDVNCDNVVNILDALAVAQFAVNTRQDVGRCPVNGALGPSSIFALMGNANGDDEVNIADAFLVAKCAVGLATPICNG